MFPVHHVILLAQSLFIYTGALCPQVNILVVLTIRACLLTIAGHDPLLQILALYMWFPFTSERVDRNPAVDKM